MPLYDYECEKCGTTHERIFRMDSFPETIKCDCGANARKICTAGGWSPFWGKCGGIIDSMPAWLYKDRNLQNPKLVKKGYEPKIETRDQRKKYMEARGIRELE